ncbi:multicopper oxidase-domain-containing protein [Lentinula edodes]|uniref:multicopper oxidase-domain-containing protein n=1 Tax=Lentinula edodes TaxID=5353 RepID=UPI001E8DB4E7|nr:multicopper oxidase-domain-containing protein [Lentinula edodes]KAH7874253.1 multicopper oxidase-domain-containing protein [Lentinula edodes]KAJ3899816.1 multicopper oxidase-domain-containing protein [Lentinula edodes]
MGTRLSTWKYAAIPALILVALISPSNLILKKPLSVFFSSEEVSRFHLFPSSHNLRSETTRTYNFTLAEELLSPNGVQKTVLTVNGLFPGPTIEVRSGDLLVVNVYNKLSEATSLHWHGIRHPAGNNSQDGAAGVTQCPIPPGANHTYRVYLSSEQYGTFWYHSHQSTQLSDGLFGALIIHPPASLAEKARPHQDELRSERSLRYRRTSQSSSVLDQVMLVGDWYHRSGKEVLDWYQSLRSHGNEPVPDAILNNGLQVFNCSKSIAKIICDPKQGRTPTFRLHPQHQNIIRLINPGSIAEIHISLDFHLFRVIEADGTQIQPVIVKEITIAPGQRYALEVIRADEGKYDRFWLRQRVNYEDFKYPNVALDLESKSIVTYGPRRDLNLPSSQSWSDIKAEERLDPLSLQPLDQIARVLPPADETLMMYVTTMIRTATGNRPFGYVNQTTWKPNLTNPVLARNEFVSSSKELIVPVNVGNTSNSIVLDIIVNNLEDGPHPFHLHGHHFWPLYTYEAVMGAGSYKWERPPTLPTTAPALRDTFVVPARGYAIFRVRFDTPGMWLFHCHVLVHLQSGMAMIFDVLSDRIPQEDRINAANSCS